MYKRKKSESRPKIMYLPMFTYIEKNRREIKFFTSCKFDFHWSIGGIDRYENRNFWELARKRKTGLVDAWGV